ncbi:MerR family transcriptional regulator [Faecalispora anaeroviscerum]|uniref:MerR family transcriptional regulator n=1 Tax=Faecalispora anaeroviscerum TaxID=2991836 RepID=UPI0024BAC4DC|nr:MerR family transcriptional regulator [Faecalispora anaeroviscerum]
MKEFYKISEIAKLYGIGADSLRYYEKIGVLRPRRAKNGYRMYGLKDIYKLSILRDLRRLNFSVPQIREYLEHQSIDHTLTMLEEERQLLHRQLQELKGREQSLQKRICSLTEAQRISPGVFEVKEFPARPCLRLNEYITRDEEMDFAIKKLHQTHESRIQDFGNQAIGAQVSREDLKKGLENVFRSVFFLLPPGDQEADFTLPAGPYLTYCYRGEYTQSPGKIREALHHAEAKHLRVTGDPFELYLIDNRDTILPQEFFTEIQIPVETACKDNIKA